MEIVQDYPHTEAWKRLCNSKELPSNIPLVSHVQNLRKKDILNRIAPTIELHLIKAHAGFIPGKSYTSQLLSITQHIEDGHGRSSMITGAAFVDLSAACDIVNHRLLIQKLYNTTQHSAL